MPCPPLPPLYRYRLVHGNDVQITSSDPAKGARSESVVGINPTNPQNLICASKDFFDREKYHSTISASYSINGGQSWKKSQLTMPDDWDGMTDPDLTFDYLGNAYLIVEPLKFFPDDIVGMGMYVYKSSDGGQTWADKPVQLHDDRFDDKQWIESDTNPDSPYCGSIYAVWGANTPLRFARSTDQGITWKGIGDSAPGTEVSGGTCYAPSICIGPDGVIHVSWHYPFYLYSDDIMYTRSTDGGNSFEPVTAKITGISSLSNVLPSVDGWPQFPNATFRVMTMVTSCIAAGNRLLVAWADGREKDETDEHEKKLSRIYYRLATDSGTNWLGPNSGQPLLPGYHGPAHHHFHPQLTTAGNQSVGCAFYDFGSVEGMIDVKLSQSCDDGDSFVHTIKISDRPWDPAIKAPRSHGNPRVTFIGEYFGLSAAYDSVAMVWTDTRTGMQELFFDRGRLVQIRDLRIPDEIATILAGVVQDGGGLVVVDHKIIRIPPGDPGIDILNALIAIDAVKQIQHRGGSAAIASLRAIIADVAKQIIA